MGLFNFFKGKTENKAKTIINRDPPEFDGGTLPAHTNSLTIRDQLVLLLIAKTNMNTPRNLGLQLDRCNFPGNEGKSVSNLVDNKLIYFSQVNGFGHAIKYKPTNFGEEFLKNHIAYDEIVDHIKQMHNPNFMLELVQAIFDKMIKTSMDIIISAEPNQSKWTGKDFEFLITGDLEISNENHDEIMTPNSFDWNKIEKDNWTYYQVGLDEFSYSWEPSGIQMTFSDDITFQKAKNIADEIMGNIQRTGQLAELVILESGKAYKF